jgi:hypothetical protein
VSLVADRAQGKATAWCACPAKRLHVVRALTVKARPTPLPLHSIALAFSLPPARQAHRHCAVVSSSTLNSATTASISNWLGQTLCHYLLYTLHTLAEPVGSKEKRKRPFFSTAMLGAPLTVRSTVAGAISCFSMLRGGCSVSLESGGSCRTCHFSRYRTRLAGTSHRFVFAVLACSTIDWSRVPRVVVVEPAVLKMLLGAIDPMAWNAAVSEVGVATVPPCMVTGPLGRLTTASFPCADAIRAGNAH